MARLCVLDPVVRLMSAVVSVWDKKQLELKRDEFVIDDRINNLQTQAHLLIEKMEILSLSTAIQYLEKDLI